MTLSGSSQLAVLQKKMKGVLTIAISMIKCLEGLVYEEISGKLKCWSFLPSHTPLCDSEYKVVNYFYVGVVVSLDSNLF